MPNVTIQKEKMIRTVLVMAACLSAHWAYADDAIKVCEPGQHKAMLAYESADQNVISFGNVFVCTPVALNTEAGMRELRTGLQAIHKNAVLLSVMPLAS